MWKEFKDFAMKGNLVDIAVAFVMGAAFNTVVTKFTAGIVSPLIGLLFDSDFNSLKWVVKEGVAEQVDANGNVVTAAVEEIAVKYGEFLTATIDFIIVAFVMFLIVKGINRMKKKEEEAPAPPAGPTAEDLLGEIRDLLAKK
ncbi:MAG: large conductance mechanosensitive channel protein MscL [Bacteroidetes bacterium]|nr:MAG: large conductance mechanosensitive channel protein MscL [Bacteroidota bacterium]